MHDVSGQITDLIAVAIGEDDLVEGFLPSKNPSQHRGHDDFQSAFSRLEQARESWGDDLYVRLINSLDKDANSADFESACREISSRTGTPLTNEQVIPMISALLTLKKS